MNIEGKGHGHLQSWLKIRHSLNKNENAPIHSVVKHTSDRINGTRINLNLLESE